LYCEFPVLQAPLQPLQDNLESQTYETFEKDVTKYACYQAAVHAALLDLVPDDKAEETVTTLMVVGAGGRRWAQMHLCLIQNSSTTCTVEAAAPSTVVGAGGRRLQACDAQG
jgi:hypothetical protein